MTIQKNLSNIMRAIRESRKLSIMELSEELGISRSLLQDILKGNSNPRIDTIEHIADTLAINPLTLLSSTYTEEQLETSILLLKAIDAISKLPPEQRAKCASLFYELIIQMDPET